MNKPKHSGAAPSARTATARTSKNLRSRQDRLDERAIAEANDDSAWEAPVEVKRQGSIGLRADLAKRAALQARLHWERKKGSLPRLQAGKKSGSKAGVMTKADLVDEVARVVELTKKQAETIVDIVFDSIVSALRSGQQIERRDFSFRGRNTRTGHKVKTEKDKVQPNIPYIKPANAKRGRTGRLNRPLKSGAQETPRPS